MPPFYLLNEEKSGNPIFHLRFRDYLGFRSQSFHIASDSLWGKKKKTIISPARLFKIIIRHNQEKQFKVRKDFIFASEFQKVQSVLSGFVVCLSGKAEHQGRRAWWRRAAYIMTSRKQRRGHSSRGWDAAFQEHPVTHFLYLSLTFCFPPHFNKDISGINWGAICWSDESPWDLVPS